jgi:hypothetical protein
MEKTLLKSGKAAAATPGVNNPLPFALPIFFFLFSSPFLYISL